MPSASNPMQQAVFRGCVECIRMLVDNPPYYSVDSCCGPDGLRPIHIAAREGHIQTLRFLSAAGACLQRSDYSGCTALHHAALSGQLRAVRWLLRHGAKILLDKRGRSPIQIAADHDHMEIVSVLAKHATLTNGATLTTSSKEKETSVKSPHNSKNSNNGETHRSRRRSQSADRTLRDNKAVEPLHAESALDDEDYSIVNNKSPVNNNSSGSPSPNNAYAANSSNNNAKPFSHLHLSDASNNKSPGDCASSSGNSSLTPSTSAPSLSPSASSAASCSCSTSDETTLLKSIVEVSDSFTLPEFKPSLSTSDQRTNSVSVSAPFFLHPPNAEDDEEDEEEESSITPPKGPSPSTHILDFDSSNDSSTKTPSPNEILPTSSDTSKSNSPNLIEDTVSSVPKKKSHHKRQASASVTSPFFLHPPENLVSETHQKVVASKMAPAPVNPSHTLHHFSEPINEPTPKLKVSLPGDASPTASSSSSPPLTPPGHKGGSVSPELQNAFNSKFQLPLSSRKSESPVNNRAYSQSQVGNKFINGDGATSPDIKTKNQINSNNNNCVPPPPPPPPPLPKSNAASYNNHSHHGISNGASRFQYSDMNHNNTRVGSACHYNDKDDFCQAENDYEDIEELTNNNNGPNHYGHARKLLRSVSAPPNNLNNDGSAEDKGAPPGGASDKTCTLSSNKPPVGCGKPGVPFIPPHFPTPPQDALIKPSEYLRSIQNKPKTNGIHSNGTSLSRSSSSRVEEALKALGVHDNHMGLMSPVPEETNAEDEFEEINPERINGCGKINEHEVVGHYGPCGGTDENNNNNNHQNHYHSSSVSKVNGGGMGGGVGMIRAEELKKVHLRKTPMSRTKSAPPLGRVLPDDHSDTSGNATLENGHEALKRTNTVMNVNSNCNNGGGGGNGEGSTVSKAAVIAELAQSSQVGGVREWKEELRRRQKEQEKAVQKEIEQYYQPVNFVSEVPSTDVTGAPIPDWKRQMMAKKAAERAKKEAEEQRRNEIEAKRMASIPMWRRQLLQRRESDGKYAQ